MKRSTRFAVTGALAVDALFASVSPAAAAPQTPTGFCGAQNMVNENSRDAMVKAMMNHTDEHGDAGMHAAVARTACS